MSQTATAHHAWDQRWATPEGRADWLSAEAFVTDRLDGFRQRGIASVLDLGCGVGRHALALAAAGFTVTGLDGSPAGLAHAAAEAARQGRAVTWVHSGIHALPFPDGAFDAVVAWNVIYHGTGAETELAAREIARVLRPGGLALLTLLSKRERRFGRGREIAPDTFVIDGEAEKDHAHHYLDLAGVARVMAGFHVIELEQREHARPGSWHWHLVAERG
ncbi:MAG: hypothetical protein OHK0024_34910 [Thalassobaculales bacterium]